MGELVCEEHADWAGADNGDRSSFVRLWYGHLDSVNVFHKRAAHLRIPYKMALFITSISQLPTDIEAYYKQRLYIIYTHYKKVY